jgi:transcription-repair coupling factor (superfamily II helicase)
VTLSAEALEEKNGRYLLRERIEDADARLAKVQEVVAALAG